MYSIMSDGNLVSLCEKPRYVKMNTETGVYIESEAKDAIGISVNGTLYNLPGGTSIEGAAEAQVVNGEVSEWTFRNKVTIEKNAEDSSAAIISVEDAVCDLDMNTEERLSAVEEALCELDEYLNA